MLPTIVRHALVSTVVSVGQLSAVDLKVLNCYVKQGWLVKGQGGPYPRLKTVYARLGYDFTGERSKALAELKGEQ